MEWNLLEFLLLFHNAYKALCIFSCQPFPISMVFSIFLINNLFCGFCLIINLRITRCKKIMSNSEFLLESSHIFIFEMRSIIRDNIIWDSNLHKIFLCMKETTWMHFFISSCNNFTQLIKYFAAARKNVTIWWWSYGSNSIKGPHKKAMVIYKIK